MVLIRDSKFDVEIHIFVYEEICKMKKKHPKNQENKTLAFLQIFRCLIYKVKKNPDPVRKYLSIIALSPYTGT